MVLQQYRSTFLAQPRRRMVREGEDGGEGEASVAMVTGALRGRACGAAQIATSEGSLGIQEPSDVAGPVQSSVEDAQRRDGIREGQRCRRREWPLV
jgi:hypothetical protein